MRVALGFKARTGRAVVVAVGGDMRAPLVIERAEIPLLPAGAFAPYHAAEGLEPAKAEASVKRDIADAHRLAASGIRASAKRLSADGHDLCGCGVLVGPALPDWTTAQILAVHVRMHHAEGVMFREVLVAGVRACGFEPTTLNEKSALEDAAKAIGLNRARLDALLATMGKAAGPPWGKDQKEAASAALAALAHPNGAAGGDVVGGIENRGARHSCACRWRSASCGASASHRAEATSSCRRDPAR